MKKTSSTFYETVAQYILGCIGDTDGDLSKITVLLPNHHIAQALTNTLIDLAGRVDMQLPLMVTLGEWAQSMSLSKPITPNLCRVSALYQALRARQWFTDANLWVIANELVDLLDELTRHHVKLPQDEKDFLSQLEIAYQSKNNSAMQFEAKVVHELWYAMNASGEMNVARAYQERLATLSQQAKSPLVVLIASALSVQDSHFIAGYAQQAPVKIFDLREMIAHENDHQFLSALPELWGNADSGQSLREHALHLRQQSSQAALTHRLSIYGASSLSQEAKAAEVQVRQWLAEGKVNIAIVAQDRLAARRLRAMLERAGIQVNDESGWKFSTLAVSTVLMRWLEALQNDFYYQDMLDLIKSPYVFADQGALERQKAVIKLEQLVRKNGVTSNLVSFTALAQGEVNVLEILSRLQRAASLLQKHEDTLSGWLESLMESIALLGVQDALGTDAAGAQLLAHIQAWQVDLVGENTTFRFSEWKNWLAQLLNENTFSDPSIESPVHLTHLAATGWRSFDAVLLLGCDSTHLPSISQSSTWFNDAVRSTLGLPTQDFFMERQRDALLSLLAMNNNVVVTWQSTKIGESAMLSPYLEMLRTVHKLTYDNDLANHQIEVLLKTFKVLSTASSTLCVTGMAKPSVAEALIPSHISPSGYNSLVACPYQYFARHMLRLNEMDEVSEAVEKRDFGQWVHHILHKFHQKHPVLSGIARSDLEGFLSNISEDVFAPIIKQDYLARAWLSRWLSAIPAYLDGQLKNEAEGWYFDSGEVPFEMPLSDDLTLRGRVDRLDHNSAGEIRVLDYKLMDAYRLRTKLKVSGEDVQLPCYASAFKADAAAFVSIEKDKVVNVAPPQELAELKQFNTSRVMEVFQQIRRGEGMPANGEGDSCSFCEMRGLCRKSNSVDRYSKPRI